MQNKYHKISVKGRKVDAHRYIMEQHIGRRLSRLEVVHHINGDKSDNRIENLKLMTFREHNILHGCVRVINRCRRHNPRRGVDVSNHKLTEQNVIDIRARCESGASVRKLGREYGLSHVTVMRIRDRQSWAHV
jgi:hypothetical protein